MKAKVKANQSLYTLIRFLLISVPKRLNRIRFLFCFPFVQLTESEEAAKGIEHRKSGIIAL